MMTPEDRQGLAGLAGRVSGHGNRGVAAPRANPELGDHAVVVGAGMAGLVAARVLADYFARVTVIERDRLPARPAPRAGVPQSRHIHILLARGMALLDQLFPGLEDELLAAGAVPIDFPGDALWLSPAGWSQRFRPGLRLVSCSRPLLEWSVRRRLAAATTVSFLEGQEATGLTVDDTKAAVTGVRLRARPHSRAAAAADPTLPAALVIDASGRSSRTPEWLGELGYPAPPETIINPFLGYATRAYARPEDAMTDWRLLYVQAKPPQTGRMGLLLPVEGDRWMVGLAGAERDYPPTDEAGFLRFAASLRSPIIHDAIRHARPLSPIHGYRQTDNRWRHYEQAQRWPERLIVLGDAACTFNPVYGQGLTMAALAGVTLNQCLQAHREHQAPADLAGLARRTHRALAHTTAAVWLLATGEDLRYPTTEGSRPTLRTRLMHRYLNRLGPVATVNHTVNAAFLEVANLVHPPTALFHPNVLLPTLRGATPPLRTPPSTAGWDAQGQDEATTANKQTAPHRPSST
jgi:2-polyprenyl-6-methoxyphenol hydroxylase-like FAD-dependent oxidoreductase